MWLASEMAAFAHVSELKSFTAAARALGVPKVAVSRAIASLEKRLGSKLLHRTTRRVSLTPAGELLQPHCRRLVSEVEAVRTRFDRSAPSRRLRVIVDPGYGRLLVTPLVPRLLESYSDLELQVSLVEQLPTVASDDWDVLICDGAVDSPDFVVMPLGTPNLVLCATPAYLARHAAPRTPPDLAAHNVLRAHSGAGHAAVLTGGTPAAPDTHEPASAGFLTLSRAHETQQVRLRPSLNVDDPGLVHASTAAGLGIGVLPEFLCRQGLAMGKLERVLPEWSVADSPHFQAVYPARNQGSHVVHQFLEFLIANLIPVLGQSVTAR